MMRVWIVTGGIGSGKTEVCRILHRLGYVCQYDSDSRVKALYDRYPVLVERIENRLGCRLRDEKVVLCRHCLPEGYSATGLPWRW